MVEDLICSMKIKGTLTNSSVMQSLYYADTLYEQYEQCPLFGVSEISLYDIVLSVP